MLWHRNPSSPPSLYLIWYVTSKIAAACVSWFVNLYFLAIFLHFLYFHLSQQKTQYWNQWPTVSCSRHCEDGTTTSRHSEVDSSWGHNPSRCPCTWLGCSQFVYIELKSSLSSPCLLMSFFNVWYILAQCFLFIFGILWWRMHGEESEDYLSISKVVRSSSTASANCMHTQWSVGEAEVALGAQGTAEAMTLTKEL